MTIQVNYDGYKFGLLKTWDSVENFKEKFGLKIHRITSTQNCTFETGRKILFVGAE